MVGSDRRRRLAGRHRLLPGAAVSVLPGAAQARPRRRPLARAPGPDRARIARLRRAGAGWPGVRLAPGRDRGRRAARALSPCDLPGWPDPEGELESALDDAAALGAGARPADGGRLAPRRLRRSARPVDAHARRDPAARARAGALDAARTAGVPAGEARARPRRLPARARAGARAGGAAQRPRRRRVRADHRAGRSELLHRQRPPGERHLRPPGARARRSRFRARRCGRTGGGGARPHAHPSGGLELLVRGVLPAHPGPHRGSGCSCCSASCACC